MEFVDILKEIMEEKSLNQSQLARMIDIKPSQVNEWLHKKSKPGYDNLKAICIALNIDANILLGLEEDKIKAK